MRLEEFQQVAERPPGSYGGRYLDIRRDQAFKLTFGREETKELLIDLLNCLLDGRKIIRDVRFSPVERRGGHPGSRTARFDIQCTGDGGEQFLLEMQFEPLDNLFGRARFYSCRMGSDQVPAGKRGDAFPMPEIYMMIFTVFDPWKDKEQATGLTLEYINSFDLLHTKTCEPFPGKTEIMLVELGKFNKSKEELTSRMDQWIFLFNHLHQLAEPIFTDDPVFQRLFQITEFNKQKLEDQMVIIDRERDMRNIKNRWRREAMQEGRLEAEREKDLSFARTLIVDTDFSDRRIASLTGLEEETVKNIRMRNQ